MRIEFLKEWMRYRVGETTDQVAGGVADVLVMRRIARPVPVAEVASVPPAPAESHAAEQPTPRIRRRT